MKNVHLFMPFTRYELWSKLLDAYRPMNVILHPLTFTGTPPVEYSEEWIQPFVYNKPKYGDFGVPLHNAFIREFPIADDDYYVQMADDDMYESGVFDSIRKLDDPVVIISMKRGDCVPPNALPERAYPTNTLLAKPENMVVGKVGGEQVFMKGSILKLIQYDENYPAIADGLMAEYLKTIYPIHYEPDLFALFNFYEPGRWDKGEAKTHGNTGLNDSMLNIQFGVMVNDPERLDMVLRQSQIKGNMHYLDEPESATKGLNKLLAVMEAEGADIAVLCHQDMFFRHDWIKQVEEQLAKLPDSWLVAGSIGKDMRGRICGKFHAMQIPNHHDTSEIHNFPEPACCLDECVLIVNLKKGFRFDEGLEGFDLYGTLIVLQAWQMGLTAWVIDAFCEHYSLRPLPYFPDESFRNGFKWIYNKFNKKVIRIDSTAAEFSAEKTELETPTAV